MKTPIEDFDNLSAKTSTFMLKRLSYSEKTTVSIQYHFMQIKKLMLENNISYFDKHNVNLIIQLKFGNRAYSSLTRYEKAFICAANKLLEFQLYGSIVLSMAPKKAPLIFDGPIGEVINSFLHFKIHKARLSKIRLNCYRRNLFSFQSFCSKQHITSLKEVDIAFILEYINWIDVTKPNPIYTIISTLRSFMQYVYEQNLTSINYALKIPKYKTIRQPKLPSTYNPEEIEKLLQSIDRSSPVGKRNYAMILLAARLGLRASDIV
ncbi:tyrosine-type recombinase/integrase [Chondrinema litorale]|uniref:tyrosine-type recombinase/integrase n=1 Tax=Chondrinema litorale TaxID=2994555 RepID=UPI002543C975|nr:phage integrase SAM-like domain-containing protein [Chondrinema litorale]UZR99084.1 phage integrase SAM-like domain-containing protein [Chondrinema litorale]